MLCELESITFQGGSEMETRTFLQYLGIAAIAAACASAPKKGSVDMYIPNTNVTGEPQSRCVFYDGEDKKIGEGFDYGFDDISDKVIIYGERGQRTFVRRAESSTEQSWSKHPGAHPLDTKTYVEVKVDSDGDIVGYLNPHIRYEMTSDCGHRKMKTAFDGALDTKAELEMIVIGEDGTIYRPNAPE